MVVGALIGVEVTTSRGTAHAAISELVDVEAVLAGGQIDDSSINDNGTTRLLCKGKSATNGVLLLGVLQCTLGVDGLVRALSAALFDQVAIGADSRLGNVRLVNNGCLVRNNGCLVRLRNGVCISSVVSDRGILLLRTVAAVLVVTIVVVLVTIAVVLVAILGHCGGRSN